MHRHDPHADGSADGSDHSIKNGVSVIQKVDDVVPPRAEEGANSKDESGIELPGTGQPRMYRDSESTDLLTHQTEIPEREKLHLESRMVVMPMIVMPMIVMPMIVMPMVAMRRFRIGCI
jgi:hypothetical protein